MLTRDELAMLNAVLFTPPLPRFTSDRDLVRELADEMHEYMTLRAAREGADMELDFGFFASALSLGVPFMFGVSSCSQGIYVDDQEPEPGFLAAFLHEQDTTLEQRQQHAIGACAAVCQYAGQLDH